MSLNLEVNLNTNNIEVKPIGEVDIYTSPEFKNQLHDLIQSNEVNITINGERLDYIDSTGLGVLMSLYKTAKEKNTNIILTNLKPNIYKLFDITGLNKVFEIIR